MDDLNNTLAAAYDHENRGIPRLFAQYITSLIPISTTSTIHDNACGPAVVTSELLSPTRLSSQGDNSPAKIIATDISPAMIAASLALIETHRWPNVTATLMDSGDLSFEQDTFSHSFTNFLVPPQPRAIGEIYRTLKPGGVAVYTTWKFHGFMDVMKRCKEIIIAPVEDRGAQAASEDVLRQQFEKVGFGKMGTDVESRCEYLQFGDMQDLISICDGPFGKFLMKDWRVEDVEKLPEVLPQVLTAEEVERGSLEMVAWIVVAKKM